MASSQKIYSPKEYGGDYSSEFTDNMLVSKKYVDDNNAVQIKISTASASNDATIDFTGLDGTHSYYIFVLNGILPATDGTNLRMRVGTGAGPTYITTNSYRYSSLIHNTADGVRGESSDSASFISTNGFSGMSNVSGELLSGMVHLFNPASATLNKYFTWNYSYVDNLTDQNTVNGAGNFNSTTAVTAVRFFMSSGNITSGDFTLYGVV